MDEAFMAEIERSESDRFADDLAAALKTSRELTKLKRELCEFCGLVGRCGYNPAKKLRYWKLGKKILKVIVKRLGLKKGEYRLSWNPGGVAISGDHTLHTEEFYLALEDFSSSSHVVFIGYYRKCNGLKDYSGGRNIWIPWKTFPEQFDNIVKQLGELQNSH